jgi:hypothetical protein
VLSVIFGKVLRASITCVLVFQCSLRDRDDETQRNVKGGQNVEKVLLLLLAARGWGGDTEKSHRGMDERKYGPGKCQREWAECPDASRKGGVTGRGSIALVKGLGSRVHQEKAPWLGVDPLHLPRKSLQ